MSLSRVNILVENDNGKPNKIQMLSIHFAATDCDGDVKIK